MKLLGHHHIKGKSPEKVECPLCEREDKLVAQMRMKLIENSLYPIMGNDEFKLYDPTT